MKKQVMWLAAMMSLTSVAVAHSDVDTAENHQVTISSEEEIPYDEYRARRVRELNVAKALPELDYGGVQGAEWGMIREDVFSGFSAKGTTLYKGQKGAWLVKERSGKLAGLQYQEVLVIDEETDQLTQVRRYFADEISERSERLAQYHRLKDEMTAAYRTPSHSLRPDVKSNGQDLYVRGQSRGYHLEWHGSETIASLQLSDNELVLSFRQAPSYTTAK